MSKVYEAILKLESDSGDALPGVLPQAQEALQQSVADANLSVNHPASLSGEETGPAASPLPLQVGEDSSLLPTHARGGRARIEGISPEYVNISPETKLFYHSDPDGVGADQIRLLRMRLAQLWEAGKIKTVFVTSAHAEDGKSTLAMNLATALSEQGKRRVVLLEGDLCHPSLSSRLGIPEKQGLAECLEHGSMPLSVLRRLDPLGWWLLPAGRPEGNPAELLQKAKLGEIFEELRELFDWIIVDTPPVLPLTDTLSLRRYTDAGLLVVRADRTPSEAVEKAISRVGSGNLLGLILNGSAEVHQMYTSYHRSYRSRKS